MNSRTSAKTASGSSTWENEPHLPADDEVHVGPDEHRVQLQVPRARLGGQQRGVIRVVEPHQPGRRRELRGHLRIGRLMSGRPQRGDPLPHVRVLPGQFGVDVGVVGLPHLRAVQAVGDDQRPQQSRVLQGQRLAEQPAVGEAVYVHRTQVQRADQLGDVGHVARERDLGQVGRPIRPSAPVQVHVDDPVRPRHGAEERMEDHVRPGGSEPGQRQQRRSVALGLHPQLVPAHLIVPAGRMADRRHQYSP